MSASMTTRELMDRLRRHYIKPGAMPGGIFIEECGLNGLTARRVDALYVGFTSTSGRTLVGHEIKVSRADWLHELDQIHKADLWADQCHEWWLVTPDETIVHDGELPAGWGHLVVNPRTRTRLRAVTKAQRHEGREPSWQITRSIMARLDTLQQQERAAFVRDLRPKIEREVEQRLAQRAPQRPITSDEQARLRDLDQIEAALGHRVGIGEGSVRPQVFAAALRWARRLDQVAALGWRSASLANELERAAKELREVADAAQHPERQEQERAS